MIDGERLTNQEVIIRKDKNLHLFLPPRQVIVMQGTLQLLPRIMCIGIMIVLKTKIRNIHSDVGLLHRRHHWPLQTITTHNIIIVTIVIEILLKHRIDPRLHQKLVPNDKTARALLELELVVVEMKNISHHHHLQDQERICTDLILSIIY